MALLLGVFILLLIVFPLIANTFFLEKFYLQYRMDILEDTYNAVRDAYAKSDPDLFVDLEQWEIDDSLSFTLADGKFQTIYSTRSDESRIRDSRFPFTPSLSLMEGIIKNYFDGYNGRPVIEVKQTHGNTSGFLTMYGKENINGQTLYLIIESPLSAIQESIGLSNQFLLMCSLIAIVLAGFIIFFVVNRFTKPILQINRITNSMSKLDFSQKIDVQTQDELGQLGASINDMSAHLEASINQLKAANAQLQEDIRQKEKIAEIRKEFISNVSHELKTPLALIMGYAEGLQLNINAEDRNAYCEIILDEAGKMDRLVKQLLEISQLESGAIELEKEDFDLAGLTRWILEKNALRLKEKGCELVTNFPEEAYVVADYSRIDQVITNYLTNALNHVAMPGQIRVTIQGDTEQVCLSVFNTGPNIPEEQIPRLWESFYKADKARTREYGGQGLGLYIVKTILNAHQADFGVNNLADGVEFWFTLPAAPPADDWDDDAVDDITTEVSLDNANSTSNGNITEPPEDIDVTNLLSSTDIDKENPS